MVPAPRRSSLRSPIPIPETGPPDLSFLRPAVGDNVPVRTLSTGNASALAESWYGSGKGVRNLIAFSIGPCASAGIISNGALLSGAHGLASSVQWLALNPVEREDYRRMGCLEAEGGAAGIVRRLVWRVKSGDRSRVLDAAGGDFNAITLDMILKAARDNDGVSISVIRDTVKYLAMAVSNVAAVVDPELIVLGGILESSGDLLLEPIRQECARRMPPGIFDNVRIEVSPLGATAPDGRRAIRRVRIAAALAWADVRVGRRIVDACRLKRIASLPALAAQPAMRRPGRIHARERQLEGHPELRRSSRHLPCAAAQTARRSRSARPGRARVPCSAPRRTGAWRRGTGFPRAAPRRCARFCGSPRRRPPSTAARCCARVDTRPRRACRTPAGFRVRAQCDVGIHVAHAELEAREGLHRVWRVAERRAAQQLPDDALLTFFPREPSGDINWMDNIRAGFLGGEHGAVQTARQHHE